MDPQLVSKIKSSTVAIGLRDGNNVNPYTIFGTGFIVNPEGYVITAAHVFQDCLKKCEELHKENDKINMSIILLQSKGNNTDITLMNFDKGISIDMGSSLALGTMSETDIAILRPVEEQQNLTPLTINPKKLNVLDEIFMCGYPGGGTSLKISANAFDVRMNPLIQTGKIAGFLPIDSVEHPVAIQTDIIGTGGSSGSPILDTEGNVIAMAQSVIGAKVFVPTKEGTRIGLSNMGMVFGLSANILQAVPDIIKKWKQGETKFNMSGIKFAKPNPLILDSNSNS